jgi:ABC-type amino acid transport substrate-binding protein
MKNTFWNTIIALGVFLNVAVDVRAWDATVALRVGVAPVSPPMIFKEGSKITGLEADFAQALGKYLSRPIKFVELPWEDLIDALVSDKIDIIMSSMTITRAREFRIAFSDPYMRIDQMALIRATDKNRYTLFVDAAATRTFGVKKGTTGDALVQQEFPRAKRKYFKSDEEGATALRKGKIDLFIDDSSMIWRLMD